MWFDSGPACWAVNMTAGDGGATGGAVSSPAATSAAASASSACFSAASKLADQAGFTSRVEPLNCNADSGRTTGRPACW